MFTLILDDTLKETTVQGTRNFPFEIYIGGVSSFDIGYLDWHWHDYFEINFVTSGSLNYFIENKKFDLQTGDAVFINSGRLHHAYSGDPAQNSHTIVFGSDIFCSDTASQWYHTVIHPFMHSDVHGIALTPDQPWMRQVLSDLQQLYDIYDKHSLGYELAIKGQLCSIFAKILQNTAHDTSPTSHETEKMKRMRHLLSYVSQNYGQSFSLAELAAKVHLSEAECSRFFSNQMHQPLFAYINQYRIERSCELLVSTDLPISEIALRCGFNSFSYYSKRFHQRMHCTPSDYRQKIKNATHQKER